MSEQGWMPIETAPRDGTEIDLHDGQYRVTDCRWYQYGWAARGDRGWEALEGILEPTHWRPLPPPPIKENKG